MENLLLKLQHQSEPKLFQLLYQKRHQLSLEEQLYFNYIANTFKCECLTASLMFPSTIMAFLLNREYSSPNLNKQRFSRYSKLTIIFGLPGFHMMIYSLYRRLMTKPPHQASLEQKYINDLKPKIKIVDSSR